MDLVQWWLRDLDARRVLPGLRRSAIWQTELAAAGYWNEFTGSVFHGRTTTPLDVEERRADPHDGFS